MAELKQATYKTIDEVLATIKTNGIAKPNLYNLKITFPSFNGRWNEYIGLKNNNPTDSMIIACESVNFPPKTISTDDTTLGRNSIKIAKQNIYDTIQVSFRCSADMREKKLFDAWMAAIIGSKTGNLEFPDSYRTQMSIEILTQQNDKVVLVDSKNTPVPSEKPFSSDFFNNNFSGIFGNDTTSSEPKSQKVISGSMYLSYLLYVMECYPISVSCNQLSYASQNEVMHVDVTFAYTKILNEIEYQQGIEEFSSSYEKDAFVSAQEISNITQDNGVAPLSKLDSMKSKITQARNIMTDTRNTIIGLSGLGQGETLNIFNKLNSIVEGYTGISIGDGVRMIRETRDDIKAIKDTDILAADNKDALLAGANNLLEVL